MATHTHTPGPWRADRRDILAPDCRCIAEVCSGAASSLEEADANERLIAAAPQLLEALRVLLNAVEGGNVTICDLTMASLAIAAATGEAA